MGGRPGTSPWCGRARPRAPVDLDDRRGLSRALDARNASGRVPSRDQWSSSDAHAPVRPDAADHPRRVSLRRDRPSARHARARGSRYLDRSRSEPVQASLTKVPAMSPLCRCGRTPRLAESPRRKSRDHDRPSHVSARRGRSGAGRHPSSRQGRQPAIVESLQGDQPTDLDRLAIPPYRPWLPHVGRHPAAKPALKVIREGRDSNPQLGSYGLRIS